MTATEEFLPYIEIVEDLLRPLIEATEDFDAAEDLLRDMGYAPPSQVLAFSELGNVANAVVSLIGGVRAAIDTDDQTKLLKQLVELIPELGRAVQALNNFHAKIQQNFAGSSFIVQTDILAAIPGKLTEYLIVRYLENYHPAIFAVLFVGGIIDLDDVEDTPTIFNIPYRKRSVNWDALPGLLTDPLGSLKANLDGGDELVYDRLLYLLYRLGLSFGLLPIFGAPKAAMLAAFNQGADLSALDAAEELSTLYFPVIRDPSLGVGFDVYPLVDAAAGKYTGLALGIRAGAQLEIPLTKDFRLEIKANAEVRDGLGLRIRRDGNISFVSSLFTSPAELAAETSFGIKFSILPTESASIRKLLSLGAPAGTRFEIGSGSLSFGVEKLDALNVFVEADLKDGLLSLKAEEADGFIATLLPAEGITGIFNLGIGVSNRAGLYFKGTSGLYIQLPLHLNLGPIEVNNLSIGFGFENNQFPLTLTSGFGVKLGPLAAVVEEIGVRVVFKTKSDRSGNLGPLDVSFGFNPPNGVGLSIDAGVVKGGGYLYFDFDKEEYAGALELVISEFLTLKAISLVTTRMPDGSKGFSMLIIITAEFGSPIQLSFGFTLSGVGGLLGLNRTMLLQPLAEGVRTGAVNSVMFPTNVVANAPRIISDLRSFFPPHEGIFLIGPMAKIGWGTPNLVTLSLGVIIEIPGNIAILGVLKITLPDEDAALLVLQLNFIGAIEFDKKRAWFFASMFESRILFITIEGEMGLLVAWGDDANFVVSVGGFHPAFTAPPLPFPEPRRIAISILNTDFARIRVEGYFAVTSNTVQFGARAELYFGLDAFNIDGHLAFDALFQFSPFYFIITISASLSVKVFGIGFFSVNFRGSLEGPTPWKVAGTGSISLLFFDIDVDFSHTWGEEAETTLPPINVVPLLVAEFEKLENWKAEIPPANRIFVSLRKIEAGSDLSETSEDLEVLPPAVVIPDDLKDKISYDVNLKLLTVKGAMSREDREALLGLSTDDLYREAIKTLFQRSQFIVLHPLGTLKISQRAVPLELTLDKVGAQKPGDANYFTINVTSPGLSKKGNCEEPFAMAQFKNMSDSQKLSSPAYQKWNSGVELSADTAQANTSLAVKRVVRYEKIIIDTNYKRFVKPLFVWFANLFTLFLNGNAVSRSSVSQHYFKQKQPFEDKVAIQADIWVVASSMDNSPLHPTAGSFTSQAKAYEYMQQQVAANSELSDQVHVIPQTEVRRAA